jgi:hypothetical protein
VANFRFSGGELDSDVYFSSNVTKGDEIGTGTAAMDDGSVPSQLSEWVDLSFRGLAIWPTSNYFTSYPCRTKSC